MRPLDLTCVGDELYSLPPGSFIAARDEFTQQARDAGDAKLATAIRKLRRPTVSAWLVNQLSRQAGDDIAELLSVGEALRQAQQALAGGEIRDLSRQRRDLVGALIRVARRLADDEGQPLSAQARREVASTLEAALADPAAAELLRGGRLTTPLSFVGLGATETQAPIELGAALQPARQAPARRRAAAQSPARKSAAVRAETAHAAPADRQPTAQKVGALRPARAAGRQVTAQSQQAAREAAAAAQQASRDAAAAERAAREAAAAKRDLREASEHVQEAEVALDDAGRRVQAARAERDDTRSLIADLEAQLAEAHTSEGHAIHDLRDAQRQRDHMARSLVSAQRRLAQAWARASKHR